jgi:(4-(4-[2-(gamma-L-glutamylamino)ethyl]phenoxymethyl)furan-2-yl)methanamine synthase
MTSPPLPRDVLALDVGGANIKAADGTGWNHAEPFAMWRDAPRLAEVLTRIIRAAGPRRIVATMTGEIADCFADRRAGVTHIVRAVAAAAEACGCDPPGIYRVDGRIVAPDDAVADPLGVAASNWHAVARLAASLVPEARALLVDIGSTTTDIVPLVGGRPAPLAADDAGRMATGELVYTGVERTPVPAIVRGLPHRGIRRPVASERFAESRDAWLVLGGLAEDPASRDTADGGPFTPEGSRIRLARAMLLEPGLFTAADAERAARWIAAAQARQVARAVDRVARRCGGRPEAVVYSGHGERLARMAFDCLGWSVAVVSLPAVVGAAVSRSAPAHALAAIVRGELA